MELFVNGIKYIGNDGDPKFGEIDFCYENGVPIFSVKHDGVEGWIYTLYEQDDEGYSFRLVEEYASESLVGTDFKEVCEWIIGANI